jgi:hypothetical protein
MDQLTSGGVLKRLEDSNYFNFREVSPHLSVQTLEQRTDGK